MKAKRGELDLHEVNEKSSMICRRFTETTIYKNTEIIACYMPIKNEVDLCELIDKAFSDGKRICIPVTVGEDMYFSEIYSDEAMEDGKFGIKEPENKRKINDIDVILTPGLAFDCYGGRIGWGKGYYDRAIKNSGALTVGICYEFQICDKVETEIHDCRMDYILTESELIVCG